MTLEEALDRLRLAEEKAQRRRQAEAERNHYN